MSAAHDPSSPSVFEAAGGYEGLLRLAHAWHARVVVDEVVGHAFSHGFHPQHTERLAAYWAEALGGPMLYTDRYGDETSVVRMHSGNGPHDEMNQRAVACFDLALRDVDMDPDQRLGRALHDYFAWATTTTMDRFHGSADEVPDRPADSEMVVGRTRGLTADQRRAWAPSAGPRAAHAVRPSVSF